MSFWQPIAGGLKVEVKVQPKSRRPGVQGRVPDIGGERLRIGVSEPAEGGRANNAACHLLAKTLGLPDSAVSVAQGASRRQKTLHAAGDPSVLAQRLEGL